MAGETELAAMISRAMTDIPYRSRLISDPAGAAAEMGYSLSPFQISILKTPDTGSSARLLEKRISK